ncbi:MAG TPA: M81 family metallopeptidase [Acidimicrobiia bacterium]|nr:M81 family metallopeptidase [Acidimicrobiia bacterium]
MTESSQHPHRVLVGGIRHELNSFVPGTVGMDVFSRVMLKEGPPVIEEPASSMIGAVEVARRRGIELVPTLTTHAGAGGPVEDEAYTELAERLLELAAAQVARRPVDAVYLHLHGAMATTRRDDPEGELIEQVRAVVGPEVPIAISLDLHAHFTDRMAQATDLVVGFRTCPHTDVVETGARLMEYLGDMLDGTRGPRATTVQRKIPLIASAEAHDTTFGPLTAMQARARELEQTPGVLAISIFATQPWMDVPDIGWSAVVSTDGDVELAQQTADTLARELWERREMYDVVKTPISVVLAEARLRNGEGGPVVASDGPDSPTAGAAGDGTAMLAEIVRTGDDVRALMLVTDPVSVDAAIAAGPGATIDIELGGRITSEFYAPLPVTAEVLSISTGGEANEFDKGASAPLDLGKTAVLRILNTTVLVTEFKADGRKLGPYLQHGLDPRDFALVQVKSAGAYRAEFEPIASVVYDLDTRGPCDSELTRMPYRRITRPLWPFDRDIAQPW